MMFFHGNNFYPISQHWISMVTFAVDIWTLLLMVGTPFRMYAAPTESMGALGALQVWTSVSIFTVLLVFWGTLTLCQALQKPFTQDCDTFNIDALIAGTEETCFANLRASWNVGQPEIEEARAVTKTVLEPVAEPAHIAEPEVATAAGHWRSRSGPQGTSAYV